MRLVRGSRAFRAMRRAVARVLSDLAPTLSLGKTRVRHPDIGQLTSTRCYYLEVMEMVD